MPRDDHEDAILDALRAPTPGDATPSPHTASPTRIHATLPDDGPMPGQGDALRVVTHEDDAIIGRMRRSLGQRRVEIELLSPTPAPIMLAASVSPAVPARFPAPTGHTLDLRGAQFTVQPSGLDYEPSRVTSLATIEPRRPAAVTGIEALDLICPLPLYGLTLVVDLSEDARAFDGLCARLLRAPGLSVERAIHRLVMRGQRLGVEQEHVTISDAYDPSARFLALRAMASWASRMRDQKRHKDQIAIASLPTWGAPMRDAYGLVAAPTRGGTEVEVGEAVSWIAGALASVRGATITSLCRLPIDTSARDMGLIIDTLSVGGADALIVIDERGRLDPIRSSSKATQTPKRQAQAMRALAEIDRARRADSHGAIFGLDEVGQRGEDGQLGDDPDRWSPCLRT